MIKMNKMKDKFLKELDELMNSKYYRDSDYLVTNKAGLRDFLSYVIDTMELYGKREMIRMLERFPNEKDFAESTGGTLKIINHNSWLIAIDHWREKELEKLK